jgi:hypothetical protein
MPGSSKPSSKKEENNSFIDENWITIGQASFLRRDYDAATKNFQFIKKFYTNDPSNYIGELWTARANLAQGKITEAGFHLDNIKSSIEIQKEKGRFNVFLERFKSPEKGEVRLAPLPRNFLDKYYLTRAEYHLKKGERDLLKENLVLALDEIKKKQDRARIYYILGQLEEEDGKRTTSKDYYALVLKSNAPYDMAFSARLKRALLSGDAKLVKDLNKMLKDAKNAEYRDQIYYALAQIELNKGNKNKTFDYLTQSAFYSTINKRQKAMAYELMGDLRFKERNYVVAQKYYDSTVRSMPETYPNAEGIRNKSLRLSDLVVAVETAAFEDSVLRIANMPETQRDAYLKNVIVILKEREKERKRKEAIKLAELAKNETSFNQTQGGSKWYFRNAKTRAEGFDDFKRQWGVRADEDNWRRSDKMPTIIVIPDSDTLSTAEKKPAIVILKEIPVDSLTVEILMKNVPMGDSARTISEQRLAKSLYDAGIIYKNQLNEESVAAVQFNGVLQKQFETEYKLMSAFELYKLNEKKQPAIASVHKYFIINTYPESDYANFLLDPDYFIKKKELDALAEKVYIQTLNRYKNGLYYQAMSTSDGVIINEPTNEYRAKYMLIKSLCQGKLNENKNLMIPTLEQIIKEYPKTDEQARAQEILGTIKNGYSKNEKVDFSNKSIYKYNDNTKQYVIIFFEEDQNSSVAKTKVSDFSKEFFSRDRLKVTSKIYGTTQSVIFIEEFETDLIAKEYIRIYKSTRKHLFELQNSKILAITQENLRTLFETEKLKEYEDFYLEFY